MHKAVQDLYSRTGCSTAAVQQLQGFWTRELFYLEILSPFFLIMLTHSISANFWKNKVWVSCKHQQLQNKWI